MIVPLIGVGALVGYYLYNHSKKNAPLSEAAAASQDAHPAAPPPATGGSSVVASPITVLAGFGTPAQNIRSVNNTGAPINYPPATTSTDPAKMAQQVIRYQAAQPVPSGQTYYPADGDLWAILIGRLGGTSKARLLGQNKTEVIKTVASADLAKLNGFVAAKDFDAWLKAKKPLLLPTSVNDVSGPVPGAMGQIQ